MNIFGNKLWKDEKRKEVQSKEKDKQPTMLKIFHKHYQAQDRVTLGCGIHIKFK